MSATSLPPDMLDAVKAFDDQADQIVRAFVDELTATSLPEKIYHYTNDVGLKGILETGQLWLTDIFDLNDPSELRHSFSHAVDSLHAKAKATPDRPEATAFADRFANFRDRGGLEAAAHFFVCSFSSRKDDLGQWRAYADNGRGYAVGFDTRVLENAFTQKDGKPIPNNSTFSVSYDEKRLISVHKQIVENVFDLISLPRGRGLNPESVNQYMKSLHIALSLHVLRAGLFSKHWGYDNEHEYRFMQVYPVDQSPEVKRRARPYQLVRFREFDWRSVAPRALLEIVIGPAADALKAPKFARNCLTAFHTGDVKISNSEIPYRIV